MADETMAADEPRALVRAFALLGMERKLAANDATKGDWRDYDWMLHYRALLTELGELLEAIQTLEDAGRWGNEESAERENVLAEAADCANYLMMICDVVGALPPTDERGG